MILWRIQIVEYLQMLQQFVILHRASNPIHEQHEKINHLNLDNRLLPRHDACLYYNGHDPKSDLRGRHDGDGQSLHDLQLKLFHRNDDDEVQGCAQST